MRTENTGVSGSASGIADCMMMVLRPVHRLRPDCIPLRAARLPLLAGSMRSRMLLPQLLAATIGACRMRRAMLGEADITKLRLYVPWPSPVIGMGECTTERVCVCRVDSNGSPPCAS
jgi:hypothetical protein